MHKNDPGMQGRYWAKEPRLAYGTDPAAAGVADADGTDETDGFDGTGGPDGTDGDENTAVVSVVNTGGGPFTVTEPDTTETEVVVLVVVVVEVALPVATTPVALAFSAKTPTADNTPDTAARAGAAAGSTPVTTVLKS
jgi:hypothetical protein